MTRFFNPTPQNFLNLFIFLLLVLLFVHLLKYDTTPEVHMTSKTQVIMENSSRFNKRRVQRRLQTTERQILTTTPPFLGGRFYTYVEDFLANYDKFPLTDDEKSRVDVVVEAALTLKNRRLFSPALSDKQRDVIYRLLGAFHDLAVAENIRYFIYGGTLLGSFRHHDIIPYDDDVDIIIDDRDREKLRQSILKSTLSMSTLSPDHYKLFDKNGTFTNLYHDWTYPYIDISFYKLNETHILDLAFTYGKYWNYNIQDIFPLHLRPLGPLQLPSPKDTYKYLQETYDLSMCSENYYSHQLEMIIRCRLVTTPCKYLNFPFVRRSVPYSNDGTELKGVNETLEFEGRVLSWRLVEEPEYQVKIHDPFTLQIK